MQEHIGDPLQEAQDGQLARISTHDTASDSLLRHAFQDPIQRRAANDYAELKQLIKQQRLLDTQPMYYAGKIFFTMGLLVMSLTFLVFVNNFWLQLLNAAYLGFVFTQIGFLTHDTGHRQTFRTSSKNHIAGLLLGNVLLGVSYSWWVDRHNQHHGHPNQLTSDPDIDMPFIAFTEEEAQSRQHFLRFMVKYQAYFFFPLLLLVAFFQPIWSIRFLIQRKVKHPLTEFLLMILHYVLYFGLLIFWLNNWQIVLFMIIHYMLYGFYLGSVFAPNHKGMPVLDKDSPMDFLHQQILTSRNIKAHPLIDFWYGGLNYQIEHHLFPNMPRNRLRETQRIVKAFCKEHSIPYYETSTLQSYREILHYLHEVSAPLRAAGREETKKRTS